MRTLLDSKLNKNCPACRSALVVKELQCYDMDMSETRLAEESNFTEESSGYTFYWSGRAEGFRKEGGEAFTVWSGIVSGLEQLPSGFNDQIMSMRLPLMQNHFVSLVSVYTPTMYAPDNKKFAFYLSLKGVVHGILCVDNIGILGNCKALVGNFEGNGQTLCWKI